MPINPIHVALMSSGKILVVAGSGNCPPSQSGCPLGPPFGPGNGSGALLLNPTSGSITQFSLSFDAFCNGMILLSDGRAFINGGSIQYDPFLGETRSFFFDPSSNAFSQVPQSMAHGRWYPTLTTLGDGRVVSFSGTDENGGTNNAVEIYTIGSGWSPQYIANWTPPLYPRMHLLPNGKLFYSGSTTTSRTFDPSSHTWSTVATTIYGGNRFYGTSVLLPLTPDNGYDPQVIIMGGDSPATATTEVIDMGSSNPSWTQGPSMSQARVEMNAVMLPSGRVLALGGAQNDEDTSSLSLNADLYNPDTNSFSPAGANSFERLYHSVALLLPDATVWVAGGNPSRGSYESHVEIYQPAYLFQSNGSLATRPSIASAPASIGYGQAFTVQTPDASDIASVVLIRNAASTHSMGMDQRMVGMSFSAGSGLLTVTAPPNGNIAPPGYYMLFILDSNGVPSVSSSVLLNNSSSPAPTVSSISPNSGTTSGGTAVTIAGTGFQSGAKVTLGGTSATGVTVVSSTKITATTPSKSAGGADVVVTNTDTQSGKLTQGFTFIMPNPKPTVTSISPASGTTKGGIGVTITGTGFLAGATVSLGGTAATGVTVVSGNTITATTAAASAGAVNVVVTNTDSQSGTLTQGFTYITPNPKPSVTAISPNSGSINGGTAVSITGTGFLAGATVRLGGTAATGVTVVSSTSITATTAASAAGAADVVVTNTDSQNGTLTQGFTYVAPPTVTAVSPSSGPPSGGTSLHITGTGFLAGATVSFGGTAATNVTIASATSITATSPAHAVGAVNVVVTNVGPQSGTLTNGYTYSVTTPAPAVTSISPNSGTTSGGTSVTISGTGFLSGAKVTMGGTPATNVAVVNSGSITATSPTHASGAVDVVVTNSDNQSGKLPSGYSYSAGGQSLDLVVPSGDASSATVTAGQAASYTLSIQGSNTGSATLSCTGAPTGAVCSVPSSQPFNSVTPAMFNVNVSTTARTLAALHRSTLPAATWLWSLGMMGIVMLPGMRGRRRALRRLKKFAPLTLLLLLASCGGGASTGGGPTPPPTPNGTPAGTYHLVVTATANSGTATQSTTLTLVVK